MEPEHLRDDLKSEVMVIVCAWDEEKVLGLHSRKELEFYVVRVILNLVKSDRSPFYKMFRTVHYQIETVSSHALYENESETNTKAVKNHWSQRQFSSAATEMEQRELREQIEDFTIAEINNLYWYDKEMILMYKRLGNFRAIEKETGIPWISCYKNIKKSMETLKKKAASFQPKPLFSKQELKQINESVI